MDARAELYDLIRSRSFRKGGTFTLVSGRTSTIYFNLKPTMLHPDGARLIGAAVAERAAALGADYVGGLEMGAVPIVCAAAAMSAVAGRPVGAVFVRKDVKAHGTRSLIEGLAEGETLEGRKVLVVEDVTTTGGSALKAVSSLRHAGAEIDDVLTLVDREEGADEAFVQAGLSLHALYRKSEFASET
ncbi:orotate phosphoribosyltransferase [Faunimonas sp. B44]|uniref:orotate phosphoribosyltransferase n=1 Tax=Faunimonas sp. B44 TaxID=3461493 RepID=UPI004043F7C9